MIILSGIELIGNQLVLHIGGFVDAGKLHISTEVVTVRAISRRRPHVLRDIPGEALLDLVDDGGIVGEIFGRFFRIVGRLRDPVGIFQHFRHVP